MIGILARPYAAGAPAVASAKPRPGIPSFPCTLEIGNSEEALYAHLDLGAVEPGPGDTVIVYGAPPGIAHGLSGSFACRAQLIPATWAQRRWVRLTAYLGLTELYEVSFSDGRV